MKSLMQQALGADWDKLPPALQAHYRFGATVDKGSMDIEYPRLMQPVWSILRLFGALVDRPGKGVTTVVEKRVVGDRQIWGTGRLPTSMGRLFVSTVSGLPPATGK